MILKRISLGLCLLGSVVGCNQIEDCCDEAMISAKEHCAAEKAWHQWKGCYEDVEHRYHFGQGFKAGYQDIMAGGEGCQPALPPREYWKSCYMNPEGESKTRAWFNGFSHGVLAASQDGVGGYQQIMVSPVLQDQMIPPGAEHQIHLEPQAEPGMLPEATPPSPAPPVDFQTTNAEENDGFLETLNPEVSLDFEAEEETTIEQVGTTEEL